MGIIAATALHYQEGFARPEVACYMRQLNDPRVMAGPMFQPIRGLVFALALSAAGSFVWAEARMAGAVVAAGGAGNSGNIRSGSRLSRRHGLYDVAGAGAVGRVVGSGAASASAVGDFVLLGESSEKVAELDAGCAVRDRDGGCRYWDCCHASIANSVSTLTTTDAQAYLRG